MASIVQDAPEGFGRSVDFMNQLPKELLAEMTNEVMSFLQFKIGAVKTEKWQQKIEQVVKDTDQHSVQNLINAITYLYRSAAKAKLSPDEFHQHITASMVFNESSLAVLDETYNAQGRFLQSTDLTEHIQGVGQLVDLQWKVGLAVSSDYCRNLNSPFVTLNLTVADLSGKLTTHNLEMTMAQFRNFTNQMKEIAVVMETV